MRYSSQKRTAGKTSQDDELALGAELLNLEITSNRINKLRKAQGLTTAACARLVGISQQHFHLIEKGAVPNLRTAVRIAALFDATIEDVFTSKIVKTPRRTAAYRDRTNTRARRPR